MKTLFFATTNENKINEVKSILNIPNLNLIVPQNFNIKETGKTFKENSLIKAKALFEILNKNQNVFGEDSGLCIEALNLEPGIYSKRYDIYKLRKKLSANEKNQLILDLMKNEKNRNAYFICNISYISKNRQISNFEGILKGKIALSLNDNKNYGFSYDSIFLTKNNKKLSDLKLEEKNKISHRGIAFLKFKKFLLESLFNS
ncbi:RdgB/HAM1 family non-canonical purine NTP pyrophosphatase [Borreliella yangtzensis]|uniref:dITP/XTP pyrophosphatase n=1 Tax=Borreliella yangtzensis TaxID=683292 RepID=A0ABR6PA63_9SPIR|nr:RdgB/HAM1 family non-canonical purine NTP pyrophosphatase [Borreliella yangtzensis]MBB6042998.1 XTP/dITP diphosphohydrolase [Borreliella yangtzensis]WKC73229.1 RdgB/HAM1 family non-canonical purine NTP pyrophosphatase [Borreliella yangtzensis]WKC74147.1 RdgB/HAM1 family non-canonical purine NTP pyrophosphatase [Borreliella yangtzensis]WKC75071.1 RdgB/HAM1 family non-canonical purine NTP pyrophosphatase [Borreliella yangtzensis]